MKQRIDVSPEMVTFVGAGAIGDDVLPDRSTMLRFPQLSSTSLPASLVELIPDPTLAEGEGAPLVMMVATAACERLFGAVPAGFRRLHLPADLAAVALAIQEGACDPAGTALRLAKSIELLCGVFAALAAGRLVPADEEGRLSADDAERIVAARRLIDERWRERLTLDGVARACGVNRAKLTRGFRDLFGCSVTDAIADRRLSSARELLLATPLPVSSIGYQCGYLSNASFTRAFTRRFGVAPTRLRQHRLAA